MRKQIIRRCVIAGLVLIVALLAGLMFLSSKPPAPIPLPNPNGYDDFVKAGALVAVPNESLAKLDLETLRAQAASNAAGLRLAREGLPRECRVPVQYSQAFISAHLKDLTSAKRLAQAFQLEGKLAEREGRAADAARAYLDAIQLGVQFPRGGVLITKLVGVACESIGANGLQGVARQLSAADCREAIRRLESAEASAEPFAEMMKQEKAWSRGANGLTARIAGLIQLQALRAAETNALKKVQAVESTRRRLLVELAARAYELEKGQPPKTVAELVPAYLKAAPKDAVTGAEFELAP
jgi:hypothetical protein